MKRIITGLLVVFSFLFSGTSYALMLSSGETSGVMPVTKIDLSQKAPESFLIKNYFLDVQPPVLPSAKIVDNFDGTADAVFSWWDGDGTEVYQRSLDSDLKRSGFYSMKVDYIKRSEKYKFSFFAFQPKQDGIHNNFSKYEKLSLWFFTQKPLELIIKIQDKNKKTFEEKFRLEAKTDWQHVEFNFSKAWGINLSQIDNVFFFAQPGEYKVKGTFWIDDVYLVTTKDTPQSPPPSPTNLEYKEESGVFKFSWSDESKSGVALYEIWLAKDLEFSQPIIFWTNNNFLEFWEPLPEWNYFKVRAWNHLPEYGGKSSAFNEVWAKK